MLELLESSYGFLFEKELMQEMSEVGHLKVIKQGDVLIKYGQNLKYMPLLIDGAVKISRLDAEGDELLLYFIERGDTCSMTLNCCLGDKQSEIRAVVEKEGTIVMIPIQKMKEWMKKYDGWMQFVFESYHARTNEFLEAIDSLAFKKLDERLMKYLKDMVMISKDTSISVTHKEISLDLNSSRVVISRLLKSLEKDGKIKLHRHKIDVLNY